MIIYPIIILALLLVGFGVVWRRAYILKSKGLLKDDEPANPKDENFLNFWAKKEVDKPKEPNIETREPIERIEKIDNEVVEVEKKADPSFLKAEELFKKKQYISAEKWYLESVKADPKNAKIYSRLGLIYIDQKNYKDAIESLEESVKLEPNVSSRFFNLSYVYDMEGDKKNAIANAKKALRIEPENEKYKNWLEHLKSRPF